MRRIVSADPNPALTPRTFLDTLRAAERYAAFAEAGADAISVHVEAGPHIHRSLQAIRDLGKRAGIALNPGTPASAIEPLLDLVDGDHGQEIDVAAFARAHGTTEEVEHADVVVLNVKLREAKSHLRSVENLVRQVEVLDRCQCRLQIGMIRRCNAECACGKQDVASVSGPEFLPQLA